jgi:hypothetical protein
MTPRPLPTPGIAAKADDQIVCEKVLRICLHPFWISIHEGPDHFLGCPDCRVRFLFHSADTDQAPPSITPREFLDRTIPKPSLDEALAERVLDTMEEAGFALSVRVRGEACVVAANGRGFDFRSQPRETRPAAICDVAAQVCRAGLLG